ncbi:putative Ig domain-containing protein, partial [Dapis sp. BLCC M229]|uniref:putative Ig domain-containing protein n=1 Tax=Dapis sp. BLCC M229 TaxID=3400188 RepID=UPI003CF7CE1B
PTFADLDGDGDLDLIVGELAGNLNYFENTGTVTNPIYLEQIGTDNPFNDIDVVKFRSSTPNFADLDEDGDLDLIVGNNDGDLNYYQNNSNSFPTVDNPISDQNIDAYTPFKFEIPEDTFNDLNGDNLNFTAILANGDPLPDWLTFDATTNTFSGFPTSTDLGTISVSVTSDDGVNSTVSDTFDLVVNFPSNSITQTLLGTSGDDSLTGDSNNETIKGRAGNDTVLGKGGDDNLAGGSGNDDLRGGSGNDIISGDGGTDELRGGNNNDTLFGGGSSDELRGNAGDDLLDGGNGVDILLGGQGSDRLIGGNGQDFLTGGADADEFVLTPNQGRDTINDYEDGTDSFLLTGGLGFADLSFQSNAGSTLIKAEGNTLARLLGVDASVLGAEDFTTVADLIS